MSNPDSDIQILNKGLPTDPADRPKWNNARERTLTYLYLENTPISGRFFLFHDLMNPALLGNQSGMAARKLAAQLNCLIQLEWDFTGSAINVLRERLSSRLRG
ncbi:hypothetical protein QCA50_013716 [Cerrena zonata]|uniref:Uncharacterized protein n=1 Tax=Cerrena zonata TaxID=2478898 RepID=A0AAW0FVE3_9APHY